MQTPAPDQAILEVTDLAKSYEGTRAVDGISFQVSSREIVGLLGPNGAGKSTTINMILGILEPSSGNIRIFGKDLSRYRSEISTQVNFAAVYAHVPLNLTVRQNLHVFGLLYNIDGLSMRIDELLQEFDLQRFADAKAGLLSSGELSRLSLAKAIINRPKLLLLDEPTASLDANIAQLIRERITAYVQQTGTAVLWTSHNMREIELVCDRVMFVSHGKILLEGNPRTLAAEYGKHDLEELFIAVAREPLTLKD